MEELISKKDLLSETKISYGQLYRWKRKNLIPEDWFIKKSSFTGQETFFPKEKILERIKLILSMKEDVSLDDIANLFEKKEIKNEFDIDLILSKNVISDTSKDIFYSIYDSKMDITKKELVILSIIEKFVIKSIITLDELKSIASIINEKFDTLFVDDAKIYLFRKFGVPFIVGCSNYKSLIIDEHAVKIIEIDLLKEVSEINRKLV